MKVPIADIVVGERFRKDMGDIEALSASIKTLGQLQPIGITPDNHLVFGARRLAACKLLGMDHIEAKDVNCDALLAEQDENKARKAFAPSEQVAIAAALVERLGQRQGQRSYLPTSENIFISENGLTRDIAAAKAGLGSGMTLKAAQRVMATGTAALVKAMDAGQVSINAASKLCRLPAEKQDAIDYEQPKAVRRAVNALPIAFRKIETSETGTKVTKAAREKLPKMDESRLYEEGSLSALVLATRANQAISQIGRIDPNAIAAIDSIRAALDQQLTLIKRDSNGHHIS